MRLKLLLFLTSIFFCLKSYSFIHYDSNYPFFYFGYKHFNKKPLMELRLGIYQTSCACLGCSLPHGYGRSSYNAHKPFRVVSNAVIKNTELEVSTDYSKSWLLGIQYRVVLKSFNFFKKIENEGKTFKSIRFLILPTFKFGYLYSSISDERDNNASFSVGLDFISVDSRVVPQ